MFKLRLVHGFFYKLRKILEFEAVYVTKTLEIPVKGAENVEISALKSLCENLSDFQVNSTTNSNQNPSKKQQNPINTS